MTEERQREFYRVEQRIDGPAEPPGSIACEHCGKYPSFWDVAGPDGIAQSTSFATREDAEDLADALEQAHDFATRQAAHQLFARVTGSGLSERRQVLEVLKRLGLLNPEVEK